MSKFSRRQVIGGAGSAILIGGTSAAKAAPNTTSNLTADVCIVGAGFAGLSAALRLKQAGASVVVLEARGQVGGRSWTAPLKDGGWVDWGGQWVGSSQERHYALIKEMGCETYPSPNFGKTLQRSIYDINEYHRIDEDADRAVPRLRCPQGHLQAARRHRRHRRRERAVDASQRQAPRLDDLCRMAAAERAARGRPAIRRHRGRIGAVREPGRDLRAASRLADQGLPRHRRTVRRRARRPLIGGTQRVARRVAEKLKDEIKFNQPVRRIQWNDKGAVVQSDSIAVTARRVIVAVPPSLAGAIEYAPALTTNRMQVTQRWPQGLVIKVSMVYSAPFWRDDGLNGTSYDHISVMGETADFSNPPEYSKAGILTGFVYTDNARTVAPLAAEERRRLLLGEVAKRFGPKALEPMNYHEANWTEAQWTRGCFTGFLTPGATTLFGSAVRDPVGPIHWAGTETSTDWPSFIDGAIRSGEREAELVRKAG